MEQPIIVWFRQDLRVNDHPALWHAKKQGVPIIPLYIYNETEPMGSASKVWLHHSLASLLKKLPLILRRGDPKTILLSLQKKFNAKIYTNRCYEPDALKVEKDLSAMTTFKANLLMEPWEISPKTSPYYKVFTPFWNACQKVLEPETPLSEVTITSTLKNIASDNLDHWKLLPKHPNWAEGIESFWDVGESHAGARLEAFVQESLKGYEQKRDMPAIDGTSRLSPYLHFGQISPRQIWHRVKGCKGGGPFLRQLGWREFCYHILYHFPKLSTDPFNDRFFKFKWEENPEVFAKWTEGKTGYPIVDAGMRQLLEIGWMHNRVRMIVASFLTKDLLIPWQKGEAWFWDTLIDADLANNAFGWQWVAGCGTDSAPYFRIFNPVLQGKKFDPDGDYIKKWVPELQHLSKALIHEPWKAKEVLDYPKPIVDHKKAREKALKRYTQSTSRSGFYRRR